MNLEFTTLASVAASLFAAAVLVRFVISAYATSPRMSARNEAAIEAAPFTSAPAFKRARLARLEAGSRRSAVALSA